MSRTEPAADLDMKRDSVDLKEAEESENVMTQVDKAETRRILRKVDFRLLPVMVILYIMCFIDRSNSMSLPSLPPYGRMSISHD